MRNEVVLEGFVSSHNSLRYSPSGIANFVGIFSHQLSLNDGETTQTTLSITMTAFAEVAVLLSQLSHPVGLMIKGQLIKKHANSRELVIKVNQFKLSNGV
jgi:primosomal replication protein N